MLIERVVSNPLAIPLFAILQAVIELKINPQLRMMATKPTKKHEILFFIFA
jgi:hypothetical protein